MALEPHVENPCTWQWNSGFLPSPNPRTTNCSTTGFYSPPSSTLVFFICFVLAGWSLVSNLEASGYHFAMGSANDIVGPASFPVQQGWGIQVSIPEQLEDGC